MLNDRLIVLLHYRLLLATVFNNGSRVKNVNLHVSLSEKTNRGEDYTPKWRLVAVPRKGPGETFITESKSSRAGENGPSKGAIAMFYFIVVGQLLRNASGR